MNEEVARVGSDRSTADLDQTKEHVHKSLADAVALLDLEIEALWKSRPDFEDAKRYDKLKALIREANRVRSQIAEIEAKTGLDKLDETNALNLEEARDEILRRLARIAAIGEAEGVSG